MQYFPNGAQARVVDMAHVGPVRKALALVRLKGQIDRVVQRWVVRDICSAWKASTGGSGKPLAGARGYRNTAALIAMISFMGLPGSTLKST